MRGLLGHGTAKRRKTLMRIANALPQHLTPSGLRAQQTQPRDDGGRNRYCQGGGLDKGAGSLVERID